MKRSLGISDFLEEISSLSHSVVFLYFFALITEEGFLISSCYSLELCIQMFLDFLLCIPNPYNEKDIFPLLCLVHFRRPSYLSLVFSGALHSVEYIFLFLLCLSLLFFPQLFAKPPQTTTLTFFIFFFPFAKALVPACYTLL